jgi:hypothetical protein
VFTVPPLGEPTQQTSSRSTGPAWEEFSDKSVTVIAKAPVEVGEFTVVKPDTSEVVNRPRATKGEKDRPADPTVAEKVKKTFFRAGAGEPGTNSGPNAAGGGTDGGTDNTTSGGASGGGGTDSTPSGGGSDTGGTDTGGTDTGGTDTGGTDNTPGGGGGA